MSLSIQNALRRPNRRLRPYKMQRWDSAAVSLKAQRRQYRSIQRNTDKVILCRVIRSQLGGTQISAKAIKKPQLRSNMSASINYLYAKSRVRREVP